MLGTSNAADEQILKAFEYMKGLYTSDKWTPTFEKLGVKAYSLPSSGGLPATRGDAIVSGLEIDDILSLFLTPTCRGQWDERTELAKIHEFLPNHLLVAYSVQKGIWPVSARDLYALNSILKYQEDLDVWMTVQQSVEPETVAMCEKNCDEVRGYVRAHLYGTALVFKKLENGDMKVSYIVHADAKGSIPSSLVAIVAQAQPLGLGHLINLVKKHGAFPAILNRQGPFASRHQHTDPKTMEFTAETSGSGTATIKFDPIFYPHGADVTATGDLKLTPIADRTHVMTLHLDGDVKFSIKRKTSGDSGSVFLNGEKVL